MARRGGGAVRGDRFPCCVAWPPLAHTVTERPVLFVNSTGYFLRMDEGSKGIRHGGGGGPTYAARSLPQYISG